MKHLPFLLLLLINLHLTKIHCQDQYGYKLLQDVTFEKGNPLTLESENTTEIRISNLKGPIFVDTFSKLDKVKRIIISNSSISQIEPGALCSNKALKGLELEFVELPTISKETFKNCGGQLESLVLGFDGELGNIEEDAFTGLDRLSTLFITRSSITHIGKDFFKDLKHLHVLNIVDCVKLREIHPEAFGNLKELLWSAITSTNISSVKGLYKNKPNLTKVNLEKNKITDIKWDDFEGSSALNYFDLGYNEIKSIDVESFLRNWPNMKMFIFNNNPISDCPEVKESVKKLKAQHTRLGIFSDCS